MASFLRVAVFPIPLFYADANDLCHSAVHFVKCTYHLRIGKDLCYKIRARMQRIEVSNEAAVFAAMNEFIDKLPRP